MQTVTVSKDFLTSTACTTEILTDIAVRHCKMETTAVQQLLKQGKLVSTVRKYLQDETNGYAESFNAGQLQLDIAVLQDLPVASNPKPRGATKQLTGNYKVLNANGCKAPSDSPKHAVYKILFSNNSFEQYLQQCQQAKLEAVVIQGKKNAQLKITAAEFARWALKCKWIVIE